MASPFNRFFNSTFFICLLCFIVGGVTTLGLAPYGYWWLSLLSVAVLALASTQEQKNKPFMYAFFFGTGFHATGASWVYISIHEFGYAPIPLAVFLTGVFVIGLGIAFALPFYLIKFIKDSHNRLFIAFPLCWALSEWIRTWFLTGFPWLFLGYGHFSSPLIGWAPVGGVLFVGLFACISSTFIAFILKYQKFPSRSFLIFCVCIWGVGLGLKQIAWTKSVGEPINVGIVQPNIPLIEKWDPDFKQPTIDKLNTLTSTLWSESDWIVWPEAAIPDLFFRSIDFIETINQTAISTNTSLITGVLYDDRQNNQYFNSIIGLGDASGRYSKQRLVPFGEYVPLEKWLRGLIRFFDLPNSVLHKGPNKQENIMARDYEIASSICYEIVYPALVAKQTRHANAIITISNDAWFGDSIGPKQHFHMARMRAIETGRPMIRATNNGISALINHDGKILNQTEQFVSTSLKGTITPRDGDTPYLIWRNSLFLIILMLMAVRLFLSYQRQPLTID